MKNNLKRIMMLFLIALIVMIPVVFAGDIIDTIAGEPKVINEVMLGEDIRFDDITEEDIILSATDTTIPASSMNRFANSVIQIVQGVSMIGAVVLAGFAIKSFIKKDPANPKKHIIKGSAYSFGAIVLFCINGVLSIIKSFKPVIYLYPEDEEEVTVKLGKKENLTCTYPKYKDGWKVLAEPSGDLIELETGKELYSLYWEGKNNVKHDLTEGFIVEGENAASFLEEKLEILGLNSREKQEFIIYWLPELEANKLNYIRFETKEQIDEDMPLEITPVPDTIIRIMMVIKKINKPLDVKEQVLTSVERKGFTVVEWGGTRI